DWKRPILAQINEADTMSRPELKNLTKTKRITDNDLDSRKKEIEEMTGFDTQFVTLFLIPNWGVQILKWLIFFALVVIEILPTFLKLKTPLGQYDMEMYRRDKETEIEVNLRLLHAEKGMSDIEQYRVKEEVELNKKIIDKVVVIEEELANEMLVQWEDKARDAMLDEVQVAKQRNLKRTINDN
ncbi:hypothetical protein HXX01_04905, partial [Candidatus Nomurabacteria bacterium]|nr:hypothetical protein [Candidatus Nomurabacteria bacterium]